MDESTLLKFAKKLDQGALVTIFDAFAPDVYRYAFRLYLDPIRSDHIVGDVFNQFLENVVNTQMPSFDLRVYIFQITYQKIVDSLDDDQPMAVNAIQRHILFLRYLEDFSLNETAFIVGKSVSNVKVIQNRASMKLQRLVDFQVEGRLQSFAPNLDT